VNLEGKRAVQKCRLFGLTYLYKVIFFRPYFTFF